MYNAQTIKERVKEQQKIKGIKNADNMMENLGLGVNVIRQMSDKKGISCFALAKIADYLDCSVDYLLGRTDNPNRAYSINNNTNINGTQHNVINSNINKTEKSDTLTEQFIQEFEELSFDDKVSIMQCVKNIKKQ